MIKDKVFLSIKAVDGYLKNKAPVFKNPFWAAKTLPFSAKQINNSLIILQKNSFLDNDFLPKSKKSNIWLKMPQKWSGEWRVLAYDVPEAKREIRRKIRKELLNFGFRKLQRSIWISPFASDDFANKLRKDYPEASINFLIGRMPFSDPKKIFTDKWQINIWQKKAVDLSKRLGKSKELSLKQKKEFWQLIFDHPKGPFELFPVNWPLDGLALRFSRKIKTK